MFVNSADSLVAILARSSSWTTVKSNPASKVSMNRVFGTVGVHGVVAPSLDTRLATVDCVRIHT